jgi:hypothetical protein
VQKRLAEIVDYLEVARKRLLDAAKRVNPSFAEIRPHTDAWCVAEILTHVSMVEASVAKLVSRSVSLGREQGVGPETSEESLLSSLDRFSIVKPVRPVMTSERGIPPRDSSMLLSMDSLQASRLALQEALRDADGMNLSALARTHPILGDINIYQWALFVGQHDERHTRQIERTLREVTEGAAESAPIL